MNAVNWREPRLYSAAIAAAIGICGQLVSTLFFIFELGIAGVLILKVVFIGLMLYGIYGMSRGSGHNGGHFWLPVAFLVIWLAWMAVTYVVYGILSSSPVLAADIVMNLPQNMCFLVGLGLTAVTLNLRPIKGSPNRRLAVVSVFTLILVVLSWAIVEYATYGVLSEHLESLEYYAIFQLSSLSFLVTVLLVLLMWFIDTRLERSMKVRNENVGGSIAQ